MEEDIKDLKYKSDIFIIPLIVVVVIWFVYWVEIYFGLNFNKYGILPRNSIGLRGVLFSPFIHSDTNHLFNNSVPLFVLISSLCFFYRSVALKVLLLGGVLSGLLTWCIARESYHIGASGIVYLLFSFIFFSGIIKKHYRLIALALVIIFLYGSMVWYILPIKDGISWEGHLSGFLVGLIFAIVFRNIGLQKTAFVFSKTEFDTLFDEDGNYTSPSSEEFEDEEKPQ